MFVLAQKQINFFTSLNNSFTSSTSSSCSLCVKLWTRTTNYQLCKSKIQRLAQIFKRVKGNTHYQGNLSRVIFRSQSASKISGGSKSSQSYNNRIGYTWKASHGFLIFYENVHAARVVRLSAEGLDTVDAISQNVRGLPRELGQYRVEGYSITLHLILVFLLHTFVARPSISRCFHLAVWKNVGMGEKSL